MRAVPVAALVLLGLLGVLGVPFSAVPADVHDIFKHLKALQAIADVHGSRSVAAGYNASAEYVLEELRQNGGFDVSTQPFVVPVYTEVELPSLSLPGASPSFQFHVCAQRTGWAHYESSCDISGVRYGGNGKHDVKAHVVDVGSGCTQEDFTHAKGLVAVALVGQCEYIQIASNAEDAGAAALILFNPASAPGVPGGRVFASETWQEGERLVDMPVIGATHTVASVLLQNQETAVHLTTHTRIELVHTYNIIAQTRAGDSRRVVMVGAHLDGVPEGPGINDNGSGTATVLAMALRLKQKGLKQGVRFAWWGAEEIGLLGSRHYVRSLLSGGRTDKLARIALYLNFDMEASPNYIRLVYNGAEAEGEAKPGSEALQKMFQDFWNSKKLPYALTGMTGGSDFLPFIQAGIPASGLATGAGNFKTDAERKIHHGLANTPLDPCYHAPCDSIDNVSPLCISETSAAASDVLASLAYKELPLPLQTRRAVPASELNHRLSAVAGDDTTCVSSDEFELAA